MHGHIGALEEARGSPMRANASSAALIATARHPFVPVSVVWLKRGSCGEGEEGGGHLEATGVQVLHDMRDGATHMRPGPCERQHAALDRLLLSLCRG